MHLVRYAEADLPTAHGPFRLVVYREVTEAAPGAANGIKNGNTNGASNGTASSHASALNGNGNGTAGDPREHIAIVRGEVAGR